MRNTASRLENREKSCGGMNDKSLVPVPAPAAAVVLLLVTLLLAYQQHNTKDMQQLRRQQVTPHR